MPSWARSVPGFSLQIGQRISFEDEEDEDEEDENDEEDEEDEEEDEEDEDEGWSPSGEQVLRWPLQMCCLMKKMKMMRKMRKTRKMKKKVKKIKVGFPLGSGCSAGRCRCVA